MSRFESKNLKKTILLQKQAFEKRRLDGPTVIFNFQDQKITNAMCLNRLKKASLRYASNHYLVSNRKLY